MQMESKNLENWCVTMACSHDPMDFFCKVGTSFDDRSLETRASHKKDHSFQKEKWQFKLQWPVTSSFRLIKISTVRNHHYTTGLISWRVSGLVCYI
jgi:hypothetical protein